MRPGNPVNTGPFRPADGRALRLQHTYGKYDPALIALADAGVSST
jgi:hypothetical protein